MRARKRGFYFLTLYTGKMGTTFNSMKSKTPRPLWPWLAGAAAIAGGYTFLRNKNVNVHQRRGNPVLPDKTQIDVRNK